MTGKPEVGTMLAVDRDGLVLQRVPCLSADMVFAGWVRMVLEPGHAEEHSTITWWQAPANTKFVEWQPGGAP